MQEYFSLNDMQEVSPETLWAAHKAAIRGVLIQISSQTLKAHQADVVRLEKEFQDLSKNHKLNSTVDGCIGRS